MAASQRRRDFRQQEGPVELLLGMLAGCSSEQLFYSMKDINMDI